MAHIIVLDSNEDIFVCGICKSVFNSIEIFLDHKKARCEQEVFQDLPKNECTVAETPITLESRIENHLVPDFAKETLPLSLTSSTLNQDPIDERFSCQVCGKIMKTRKTLVAHNKSHFEKLYQCLVCGRCFIQKSHLQRHVISHKVWPESLSDTVTKSADAELLSYSCPYCSNTFLNYNQFRAHLKVHQNLKVFRCIQGDCSCFFENLENLLDHISAVHPNPTYSCYKCDENFNSLESIFAHHQSHSDCEKGATPKVYKCSKCDAIYNTAEKLSLHMQTEDHAKKCVHCNGVFASNKRLRLHLQVHRKAKPYKCHLCDSSFHVKKYLTTHMLRHDKRNFICSICKSMFKRQDLLQRHVKLHDDNMLQCPYRDKFDCKKEFSRKDKLKLHIRTHVRQMAGAYTVKENSEGMTDDIL